MGIDRSRRCRILTAREAYDPPMQAPVICAITGTGQSAIVDSATPTQSSWNGSPDHAWGTLPFVILMAVAVVICCIFPEIATWLPDKLIK
jgi:hypothetical protein